MRIKSISWFLTFACALVVSAWGQVSPLDYGLGEARDGRERYYALYKAHCDAVARGLEVTYRGIDTLRIEIPPDFKTIPLATHTDFGGLVLYVTNRSKHGALFGLAATPHALQLDKGLIDSLDFGTVAELARGSHLLVLDDLTPWTSRRGYGYSHTRRDIIVVEDGRGLNRPIAPWGTDSTRVKASYYDFDPEARVEVKNLTMHRTEDCTYRTYCLSLVGLVGATVSNIRVTTPRSDMVYDAVFSLTDCANLLFERDTVEGTYSGQKSGYAFAMDNVYGATFEAVKAYGDWGVFGTNNISNTRLRDCDINRFDIHCYGRDVEFSRCVLTGMYTIVSSMYGRVVYDSCRFTEYTPVRVRGSYSVYTPFDILIRDCTLTLTKESNSVVQMDLNDEPPDARAEVAAECWPNLRIENLTVVAPRDVRTMNLYRPYGSNKALRRKFDHISTVEIDGLRTVRPDGNAAKVGLKLFSRKTKTVNRVTYSVK